MAQRDGRRKTRDQTLKRRTPELGYYLIVTDAKETEQNYVLGLRDAIPKELQGRLVIKVSKAKTAGLVDEALSLASLQPQYGEPWIIFDRDQVKTFNQIIDKANAKGINVGWSNPCIEIWFSAYFGSIPSHVYSTACLDGFRHTFFRNSGQEYNKTDKSIYLKLCRFGDEKKAIDLAKKKMNEHSLNCVTKPSAMCPATTIHLLVDEIKDKIERNK